jgi:hypothetical protein
VKEKTKFFDIKNFSATIYTSNIIANIRQAWLDECVICATLKIFKFWR